MITKERKTPYILYITYHRDGDRIVFMARDDDDAERIAKEKVQGWALMENWREPSVPVNWFLRKPTERSEGGAIRKGREDVPIPSNCS